MDLQHLSIERRLWSFLPLPDFYAQILRVKNYSLFHDPIEGYLASILCGDKNGILHFIEGAKVFPLILTALAFNNVKIVDWAIEQNGGDYSFVKFVDYIVNWQLLKELKHFPQVLEQLIEQRPFNIEQLFDYEEKFGSEIFTHIEHMSRTVREKVQVLLPRYEKVKESMKSSKQEEPEDKVDRPVYYRKGELSFEEELVKFSGNKNLPLVYQYAAALKYSNFYKISQEKVWLADVLDSRNLQRDQIVSQGLKFKRLVEPAQQASNIRGFEDVHKTVRNFLKGQIERGRDNLDDFNAALSDPENFAFQRSSDFSLSIAAPLPVDYIVPRACPEKMARLGKPEFFYRQMFLLGYRNMKLHLTGMADPEGTIYNASEIEPLISEDRRELMICFDVRLGKKAPAEEKQFNVLCRFLHLFERQNIHYDYRDHFENSDRLRLLADFTFPVPHPKELLDLYYETGTAFPAFTGGSFRSTFKYPLEFYDALRREPLARIGQFKSINLYWFKLDLVPAGNRILNWALADLPYDFYTEKEWRELVYDRLSSYPVQELLAESDFQFDDRHYHRLLKVRFHELEVGVSQDPITKLIMMYNGWRLFKLNSGSKISRALFYQNTHSLVYCKLVGKLSDELANGDRSDRNESEDEGDRNDSNGGGNN